MENSITKDIESIHKIDAIQTILKLLKQTTGMKNSAVVSLADEKWTAACVLDDNPYGLNPGDQLDMNTTY